MKRREILKATVLGAVGTAASSFVAVETDGHSHTTKIFPLETRKLNWSSVRPRKLRRSAAPRA